MPTTKHHCTYKGKLIRVVLWGGKVVDTRFIYSNGRTLHTEAGRFRWRDVRQLLHRLATAAPDQSLRRRGVR